MAGAYCRFCGHRCFVYRVIPDGPQKGWAGHMATCAAGMVHDRRETGYDHTTALKEPTMLDTEPKRYAGVQDERERIAADIVAYCPDHGDRETSRMVCHCEIAEELRRAG